MYNSGFYIDSLIDELYQEIDVAVDFPDASYVNWLNSLEQLLYSEIIKEQAVIEGAPLHTRENAGAVESAVPLPLPAPFSEADPVRFGDIHAVYVNPVSNNERSSFYQQLMKSTATSGSLFPNTYYQRNSWDTSDNASALQMVINTPEPISGYRVICFVRPALKLTDGFGKANHDEIMIPPEFIDMVKAKLRGEAYKLANEDALAAKWLNDYNVLLETFKAWVQNRSPQFGM